jgi:hypothetical protein
VREGLFIIFRAQRKIFLQQSSSAINTQTYLIFVPTHSLKMRAKQLLDFCVEKSVQGTTVTAFNVVQLASKIMPVCCHSFPEIYGSWVPRFLCQTCPEIHAASLLDFCANLLLYDLLRIHTVRPSTRCTFLDFCVVFLP